MISVLQKRDDNSYAQYYLLIVIVVVAFCVVIGGSFLRLALLRRHARAIRERQDIEAVNHDVQIPVMQPEKPPPPMYETTINKCAASGAKLAELQPVCVAIDRPMNSNPVSGSILPSGDPALHNVPIFEQPKNENAAPGTDSWHPAQSGPVSIHAMFLVALPDHNTEVPEYLMYSRKGAAAQIPLSDSASLKRSGSVRSTHSRESIREMGDKRRTAFFNENAQESLLPGNQDMLDRYPGNEDAEALLGHLAFGSLVISPSGNAGPATSSELDALVHSSHT